MKIRKTLFRRMMMAEVNDRIGQFVKDPPSIETERLLLRPIRQSDADDMFEYASREEVTRYLLWSPHPDALTTRRYIQSMREAYCKGDYFDWAAILKSENKMIGTAGYAMLDCRNRVGEIGYVLSSDYWHRGLGSEMAKELISYGFNVLGFNRIQARCMVENVYSRRIMEKCGMIYEGTARQSMLVKGVYRDISTCAILAHDYFALHGRTEYGKKPLLGSLLDRLRK